MRINWDNLFVYVFKVEWCSNRITDYIRQWPELQTKPKYVDTSNRVMQSKVLVEFKTFLV